jgi:pimeloyl-ACP methyl ester carboxylesterase
MTATGDSAIPSRFYPFFFLATIVGGVALHYSVPQLGWLTSALGLIVLVRFCARTKAGARVFEWKESGKNTDGELMFFMHGWPDCAESWGPLIAHFSHAHPCVACSMPSYMIVEGASSFSWGCDLDELVDSFAMTLNKVLEAHGRSACMLVCHDWGCMLGMMVQRKYPNLVSRMVLHDVELRIWDASTFDCQKTVAAVLAGFLYQYWLILAFLAAAIPVVGRPLGDAMTWAMMLGVQAPLSSEKAGRERATSLMNYIYLYVHYEIMACTFGLRRDFDARNGIPAHSRSRNVPTLFMYANEVMHSRAFEQEMRDREDCDVIQLTNPEDPDALTHWYIFQTPEKVIPLMEGWMSTGAKAGEYVQRPDMPVTGAWER